MSDKKVSPWCSSWFPSKSSVPAQCQAKEKPMAKGRNPTPALLGSYWPSTRFLLAAYPAKPQENSRKPRIPKLKEKNTVPEHQPSRQPALAQRRRRTECNRQDHGGHTTIPQRGVQIVDTHQAMIYTNLVPLSRACRTKTSVSVRFIARQSLRTSLQLHSAWSGLPQAPTNSGNV
jgi:hypothetical protein